MKNPIIKITDLEYSYPGYEKRILNKFSQEVYPGEILGVIGKNGVGKSTLMRLIASIHQPLSGTIVVNGVDSLEFEKRRDYLLNFVYLAHDKTLQEDFTLKQYCHIYSPLYPNYSKETETQLMERFEFNPDDKISSLSTGNKMKVFLLFALATRVRMILVDEITAVLDPENREEFFHMVRLYADAGVTFIVATNIVEDLNGFADRVWVIDTGNLIETTAENLKGHFKKKAA
ncbi:MAG: ABC transporter ATP-binding protein [Bacteriovorax sp.]|nr:ABC transporter ATP-binding protein [Bacteriovorax sp.]